MQTTIVYPNDLASPTGVHVLARQLVEALLARGEEVTLVLAKAASFAVHHDEAAVELYGGIDSKLAIHWLAADVFEPGERQRLTWALERLAPDTEQWMCFGVEASAFVASLVAQRAGTPCASFILARDVLGRSMLQPQEIGATLGRSRRIFCANAALLDVVAAFCGPELAPLFEERRLEIVAPTCSAGEAAEERDDYLCTTGALGLMEDLHELTNRVVGEMRECGARRWLHVGTIHPRIAGRLAACLALRGLAARFDATGLCGPRDYELLVRRSRVLLKPRGEVDTALSAREARGWGVPVSLPPASPFFAAAADPALGSGAIDPATLADRLIER